MSTAIMTNAQRVVITLYDVNGNLTQNSVTLEIQQNDQDKTMTPIDMTNSESGSIAEWAPGVTITETDYSGILASDLGFLNLIYMSAMDNKFYAQVQSYFVKPGGLAANPVVITGKVLFTQAKLSAETSSTGAVWKFSAKTRLVGKWAVTGVDLTGAAIVGNPQN